MFFEIAKLEPCKTIITFIHELSNGIELRIYILQLDNLSLSLNNLSGKMYPVKAKRAQWHPVVTRI